MKHFSKPIFTLILGALSTVVATAQISFTNQVGNLSDPTHYSGVAVTINDVNNDGLDDIVILDDGMDLKIEYQQMDGVWTSLNTGIAMDNSSAWGMVAGDADNNGYSDVFSNKFGSLPDYAKSNGSGTSYTLSELPDYSLATQCVNLADMDADGDLDFFSCGDTGPSGIWENDGSGGFTYSGDDIIPMTPTPNVNWPDWDGSGNYGSTFTDYDLDGDIDLYITHCRQISTTADNPKLINQMFINDGNGNYAEDFTNYNQLRIGLQSWTTDFQDFDNDGDFDAYMTNHNANDMLLENVNGVFTDIYPNSGLTDVVPTPIQGLMRDFDNDGFVDVIVTGSGNPGYAFYKNNGDKTFTLVEDVFGSQNLYSLAVGDLNHDGFLDVYGSYAGIYTNPSSTPDAVWINDGNDNNWLAVDLEGTISNKSAVGSVVRMYGPWGIQVREVRAGESYGICNSLISYFGLGQHTDIDSVVVDWPSSGIHQVVTNPSPNQFLTIIENECVAPEAFITTNGPTVLCQGQTLDLNAPTGAGYVYEWSDGSNGQSLTISETGTYMVRVTDMNAGSACSAVSAAVTVEVSPDETPEVTASGDLTFCEGSSVTLTSTEASAYQWSNTLGNTQSVEVTESGSYTVTITGTCDDFTSTAVVVDVLDAPAPTADDVWIPQPGTADLVATGVGTDLYWYDAPSNGTLLGTGANFTTSTVSATTSFWVEEVHSYGGAVYNGGKTDRTQSGGSYHNSVDFYLLFDVLENVTLNSVKVYADGAANRTIYIQDDNGNTIHSQTFNIPDGESTVNLNWAMTPGTDYRFRVVEQGHGLWRDNNSSAVNFPYNIDNMVSIVGANTPSPQYYYYFYDWEVEEEAFQCISEREEVVVTIQPVVGFDDDDLIDFSIYPNPSSGALNVIIPSSVEGLIGLRIFNALGTEVIAKALNVGDNVLDISGLTKGVYLVEVATSHNKITKRVIVE